MIFKLIFVSVFATLFNVSAYSQIDKQVIPTDTTFRKGVLKNGLTYYVRDCKVPENRVFMQLIIKGGPCVEKEEEKGIAHFVEHMGFKGTKHFPGTDARRFFDAIGLQHGSTANGYTNPYRIFFLLHDIPKDKACVDSCLLLMHDWAFDITIEDRAVNDERRTILNEFVQMGDPLEEDLRQKEYLAGTPYAEHLNLGTKENIRNCSPQIVRNYYKRVFQPQNMAMLVVGDINADEMEAEIKKRFGDIKRGKNAFKGYPDVPSFRGTKIQLCKKDIVKDPCTDVIFGVPDIYDIKTVGDARRQFIYNQLANIMKKRIDKIKSRYDEIKSTSAYHTRTLGNIPNTSNLVMRVEHVPHTWKLAVESMLATVENMRRFGIKDEEWKDANGYNVKYNADSTAIDYADSSIIRNDYGNASQLIDSYHNSFVYGTEIFTKEDYDMTMKHIARTTTTEDIYNEFMKVTDGNNQHITLSLPVGDTHPSEGEVRELIARVKAMSDEELSKYCNEVYEKRPKLGEIDVEAVDPDVEPGTIISCKEREDGHTEMMLSNGVKVLIHPDSVATNVHFNFFRPGGYSFLPDEDVTYAGALANKCCRKVRINGSPFNWNTWYDSDVITTEIKKGEEVKCFKALFANLIDTFADTVAFANYVIEKKQNSIWSKVQKDYLELNRIQCKGKSRLAEFCYDSKPLNIERFREILKEHKSNYNGSILHIKGNVNVDSISPMIRKYIATLRSKPEQSKVTDWESNHFIDHDTTTYFRVKTTNEKANFCILLFNEDGLEYTQENLSNVLAMRSIMGNLLHNTIRDKNGDVYSINSVLTRNNFTNSQFIVSIGSACTHDKIEKVRKDIDKLIDGMAYGDLITQELVNGYITSCEKGATHNKKSDAEIATACIDKEMKNVVPDKDDLTYVRKITPESVRACLRRLLETGHKASVVVIMDEE